MFNLGFSEILVIALLALCVLGPKHLPLAARRLGRVMGDLKRASTDVREAFDDAISTDHSKNKPSP